jgi:uncharacterized protein YndB with AHSA1/START domain
MSRFGVMKHLSVLAESGLVLVRREGRERWNHLNPMPIHQVYRRWIRPFEAAAADRLLRLKHHAETERQVEMTDAGEFRALDVRLEVDIEASAAKVWESLTDSIGEWWPAQFYVGSAPKRFALEPYVGGRVFEDWGDGEGALFGTVIAYDVNRMLQWAGDMSADYGGPARTVTTFRLEETETGSTLLSFRDTPFGLLGDKVLEGLEHGWKWLLVDCLKPYLEDGVRPDRPDSLVTS